MLPAYVPGSQGHQIYVTEHFSNIRANLGYISDLSIKLHDTYSKIKVGKLFRLFSFLLCRSSTCH